MKETLLSIVFILLVRFLSAQCGYVTNVQQFCNQSTITASLPGNYNWVVLNTGHISSGQGTSQIVVDQTGWYVSTDAFGCQITTYAYVATSPNATITNITPTGCGQPTGSATVQASGGTGTYAYLWSNGQTSATAINLAAGAYIVTVTNIGANACTTTVSVTIGSNGGNDNIPPTITCPQNVTVNNNPATSCSAIANYGPVFATDNCTPSVSPNQIGGITSGSLFPVGVTVNAWLVSDASGNTSTCSATVTVNDATPPSVVCKNATVNLNATGSASITTAGVYLSSSDNCGTVNMVSVSPSTFTCANIGSNAVTLTVNDGHGNTSTCMATVTVSDVTPPNLVCKNATVSLGSNGQATINTSDVYQASADNCGMVNLQSVSPSSFNCGNLGNNTVTLTVNDCHGNTSTCSATVTVNQTQPLTFGAITVTTTGTQTLNLGNCGLTATGTIIVDCPNTPGALSLTLVPTSSTCNQSNGSIDLLVNGGTSPYTYDWSNLAGNNNPQDLSNLLAGTYVVTVTDATGQTAVASANVGNIGTPTLWFLDSDNDGFGSSVSQTSCTQPAGYVVQSGDCDDSNSAINPGMQEVCGNNVDENCNNLVNEGCPSNGCLGLLITAFPNPICIGDSTVLQVVSTTGSQFFSTTWSPAGAIESNIHGNPVTTVDLTSTMTFFVHCEALDGSGCVDNASITIEVDNCLTGGGGEIESPGFNISLYPNPFSTDILVEIPFACDVMVMNSSGQVLKTFSENSDFNFDASNLPTGVYFVQVTDKQTGRTKTEKIVKQ